MVGNLAAARGALAAGVPDLFVTGLDAPDGDPLDFLWRATAGPDAVRHSLVVTRHCAPWPLEALCGLPVGGAVDTTEDAPDGIVAALRAVAAGRRYWSASLHRALAEPGSSVRRLRLLAPCERVMLSAAAAGRDPKSAAGFLGLKLCSVRSTLKRLHRKLDVHHGGELRDLAAALGLVRRGAATPIPVGFGLLLADYYRRSQRPMPPTPELCLACPEAAEFADRFRAGARR